MTSPRHIDETGFTIVELLIVIVVIGILAAIVIVSFNGIQGKAGDVAIKSDMNTFAKKIIIFATENSRYPSSDSDLQSLKLRQSRSSYYTTNMNNYVYCVKGAAIPETAKVSIGAMSKSTKGFYWYNNEGTVAKEYTGSVTNPDGSLRDMGDICAGVIGETPDFYSRGYRYDTTPPGWQAWTN